MMRVSKGFSIAVTLLLGAGCLDLSGEGKVFACPDCTDDAGAGDAGRGGGSSVGGSATGGGHATGGNTATGGGTSQQECTCTVPAATCDGSSVRSASSSRCLTDGGCDFQWVETACPSGCAAGACVDAPCLGVVCVDPPPATCQGVDTLEVYSSPGSCEAGKCLYASAQVQCSCLNDHCAQDQCAGVVCNQPPAPTCTANGVRNYPSMGTCDSTSGLCVYASVDTSCGTGTCDAGVCNQNRCAGVVCDTPPASTCFDTNTVTRWSGGTCNASNGSCSYVSMNSSCAPLNTCTGGVCSCTAETASALCTRLGKNCDAVTATDNCGKQRTVSCGTCGTGQTCGASGTPNVCGPTVTPGRLSFSTSWQTIPNTGSQTVEFRCLGTVSTTSGGGTGCALSAGDPVQIRIDGSDYVLYGGCTTFTTMHNCMTDLTPSGADYSEAMVGSPGRLLCQAMGWPLSGASSDRNTTDSSATPHPVAVIQTHPSVVGTASLANYSTYVNCDP